MRAIATAVATAVVRFEATDVAVEVTTVSIPPMSLVIRDCTSPVRVRVKKARDWRCRWVKTSVRRACMTRCPTVVLIQVWTTPNAAVVTATASMPRTSQTSRVTFCCGSASSMTARSRKGDAIATMDDATMIATTTASWRAYGSNSAPIRRSETSRACCFSAADTLRACRLPGPVTPLARSARPAMIDVS